MNPPPGPRSDSSSCLVWIPTEEAGRYFPDFIVIDADGTRWVIEGKSDKESTDP